jgi:hypothetical protein
MTVSLSSSFSVHDIKALHTDMPVNASVPLTLRERGPVLLRETFLTYRYWLKKGGSLAAPVTPCRSEFLSFLHISISVFSVFGSYGDKFFSIQVKHGNRTVFNFSHWITDFITHPMGAISGGKPLPPDLPLFFNGSHMVGLGLYNHSFTLAMVTDMAMLLIGITIYILFKNRPDILS